MDVVHVMENVESLDRSETETKGHTCKKSILHERNRGTTMSTGSLKRVSSKNQIQWKGVPRKTDEERKGIKLSLPVLGLLASRGYKWHYIHDMMLKMRWEEIKVAKQSDEEIQDIHQQTFNSLIRNFGIGILQKTYDKNTELTLEQQTHLEIFKLKVKAENDTYFKRHPEINTLLQLIFAALFKSQPKNPKLFVANYVHHLNKHREELVVEDVDIPFDRPTVEEATASNEEERQQIRLFARKLVEECVNLASLGEPYVDVMSIINSLLRTVSPSEDEISVEQSISSAEAAVTEVLMSLLTSVTLKRTPSSEFVVDEILNSILSNVLPFVHRDSEVHIEMRESIQRFVHNLVEHLLEDVSSYIFLRDIFGDDEKNTDDEQINETNLTRTILKRELIQNVQYEPAEWTYNRPETRVKFQSKSDI